MKNLTRALVLLALFAPIWVANAQPELKKITVYTDDFAGNKEGFPAGRYDFMSLVRAGVGTIKSVRVPHGMKVTIFARDNFEGTSLVLTDDASMRYLEAKGFASATLSVSLMVEELPANSPLLAGPFVTLYKDDFAGASKNISAGQYEAYELGNVGNDQLSSLKVPKGLKVTLYEHGGLKGRKLSLTQDARAATLVNNNFNDITSSIVIEQEIIKPPVITKPVITPVVVTAPVKPEAVPAAEEKILPPTEPIIYQGDYSGASKSLGAGRYSSDQIGIGNDELSSIKVPRGFRVTLYDGDAFEGRSLILTKDARASFFADNNFNNLTSSIVVEIIPMVTLYEGDYSGVSAMLEPGKYSVPDLGIGNDQLSSVRVPRTLRVILYEDEGFMGRSLTLTQDSGLDVITENGFNNVTSSVIVDVVVKAIPTVTLFRDDLSGVSKKLPAGKYRASQLGIGDNMLSAIQIPRGLEATLYENDDFEGRGMTLRSDANMNFFVANDFNDITSSIEIKEVFTDEQVVIVYSDRFSGVSQSLTPGKYLQRDLAIGDNQISSAKVPRGMRLVMYEDDNLKGYSLTAEGDIDLSVSKVFNDRVSSIFVEDLFTPIVSPLISKPAAIPTEVPPAKEPVPPTQAIAQTPSCEMTTSQFQNAYAAIDSKPFQEDRMSMAKLSTKGKCLTILQIRNVASLFMNEDQTIEFVKYAYDLCKEKTEYYLLEDVFKFMSTREEFTRFLKSK